MKLLMIILQNPLFLKRQKTIGCYRGLSISRLYAILSIAQLHKAIAYKESKLKASHTS